MEGRRPRVDRGTVEGTPHAQTSGKACNDPNRQPFEVTMEEVLSRENMLAAHKRVLQNGGAPGVDGVTVDDLWDMAVDQWEAVRKKLLSGTYKPQPVRKVEIPKPGGGKRMLGIPTALDRLIQQALLQVLSPLYDPAFSDASFGFRPGRNAHDALDRAKEHVSEGYRWVVDMDLEKFFDRVNHDILMSRIARRVKDKRILKLIRVFLHQRNHGRRRHQSAKRRDPARWPHLSAAIQYPAR